MWHPSQGQDDAIAKRDISGDVGSEVKVTGKARRGSSPGCAIERVASASPARPVANRDPERAVDTAPWTAITLRTSPDSGL